MLNSLRGNHFAYGRNHVRSILLGLSSVCLALLLPSVAWCQGAVYAMTNAQGTNQIVVWSRASDGTLTYLETVATGGGGSGIQFGGADNNDTLGSQGSIAIDSAHRHLFAINTNNTAENLQPSGHQDCNQGSISSFLIGRDGKLTLVGTTPSGGLFPDSLALNGSQLYVLNAGGGAASGCGVAPDKNPNVTGFQVSAAGVLTAIPGATQAIDPGPDGTPGFLNCDNSSLPPCGLSPPLFVRSPAEVQFAPNDKSLVVTVKGTNAIYVFPVNPKGTTGLGTPTIFKAANIPAINSEPTYFGFTFDSKGHLIVSEPFGAPNVPSIPAGYAGAVSSFAIGKNGTLSPISSHVADGQTAPCWVVLDPSGLYAYTTNNATGDISSFTLGSNGALTLLQGDAAILTGPNDMATVKDGQSSFLYVVASGTGQVYAYQIGSDGTLTQIGSYSGGLPPSYLGALPPNTSQGIAAY